MTVGEKIQFYRKQKGLSQEELGKLLIVSRQTVSQWENGQTYPTVDNLMRLREVFGITMDDLVKEGEPALPETVEEPLEIYDSKPTRQEVDSAYYEMLWENKRFLRANRLSALLVVIVLFLAFYITFRGEARAICAGMSLAYLGWVVFGWSRDRAGWKKDCLALRNRLLEDRTFLVKAYENYMTVSVIQEGKEQSFGHIKYDEIEAVLERQAFYVVIHKKSLLFFRKNGIASNGFFRTLFVRKLAEYQKTHFTQEQLVRYNWWHGLAILSLMIGAFFVPWLSDGYRFLYWWDILLLAPLVALIWLYLHFWKKGFKAVKRSVIWILGLLFLFVAVRTVQVWSSYEEKIVFSVDAEYIRRAEDLTGMDIPEGYYTTVEPANEIRGSAHYYWDALLEYYETDEIENLVYQDTRWISSTSFVAYRLVTGWYLDNEELWDRIAVYNVTTDAWNTVPEDGEKCRYIAFLWYQSGEMLVITEFKK